MRRPVVVLLVVGLTAAVLVSGAWGYHAKVWLMDDYEAGYEAGAQAAQPERFCGKAMQRQYDGESYLNAHTADEETAFWIGCMHAVNGVERDSRNVAGYLDD